MTSFLSPMSYKPIRQIMPKLQTFFKHIEMFNYHHKFFSSWIFLLGRFKLRNGMFGLAISIMVWLVLNMVAWEKLDDPKIKLCLKLEVRQVVPYDRCTRTTKMTMSISTTKWLISTSISKNYHNFMIYNLQLAKAKRKINASAFSSVQIQIHIVASNHIL